MEATTHPHSSHPVVPIGVEPDFWPKVCADLVKKKVGKDFVDRWIVEAVPQLVESLMVLRLPTLMHSMWIDTYYRPDVESAIARELGRKVEVRLVAESAAERAESDIPENLSQPEQEMLTATLKKSKLQLQSGANDSGLNPKFTFSTFVVGDNSEYCKAAAVAVAEAPGCRYNPLLFFGGTGLGKTHLMTAIGHQVRANEPRKQVLFVTGEQFTNEFIVALQRGQLAEFRAKYRQVDVLLIDDIHFVAGKDSTQEEFFHTFNTLINSHRQVVLTSDRPPGEIPRLEKRLVSRFQWGIAAEIQPPGVETRIAILQQKAEDWKIDLDRPVLEFMAKRIRKNVRRLEGALLRLSSYASLYRKQVTVERAEEYLKDILMEEASSGVVSMNDVQKAVATYFDVRMADMIGRRRTSQIVMPRQIAMFLARQLTGSSLKDIGYAFGGRDHGTVIHACKKVNGLVEAKPETRRIVEFLKDQLTQ